MYWELGREWERRGEGEIPHLRCAAYETGKKGKAYKLTKLSSNFVARRKEKSRRGKKLFERNS